MTRRAWAYIISILVLGTVLSGLAIWAEPTGSDALTFVVLTALTILTQFFEAEAPGRQSYYTHLVFLFAGVFLLHSKLFALLVIIPHLVEWVRKRLSNSSLLRDWYLQPFNIATHLIAGLTAHWVAAHWLFAPESPGAAAYSGLVAIQAALLAALIYVLLNHVIIGLALFLARGISLRESGVLDLPNLLSDLVQLCLGYVVAVLWQLSPFLIVPALAPLVMIYRALSVPQLQQEAHTDSKTGLLNARRFGQLFAAELERASRFSRPLAVIMADLDLLRNVNNTYGHLAGDIVLGHIGRIIRETARELDIAGRFGGEEFSIGLIETDLAGARVYAERLREAVASAEIEVPTSPQPIHVTLSLGVACYPEDALVLDDLIHQADVAVYQAKLKGRNCVVCASDVPHSVKLESAPQADRLGAPYAAAFATRTEQASPASAPKTSKPNAEAHAAGPARPEPAASPSNQPASSHILPVFVTGVIALGVLITVLGASLVPQIDWAAVIVLVMLAGLAEYFQVNVYGLNTVSVSVSVAFAAALIAGVIGVAAVSAGIALAHYFKRRPLLYKTAFNWSIHVLAGAAPALGIYTQQIPLQVANLPLLVVLALAAALMYYGVESGLIAIAIGLAQHQSPRAVWRDQFRWLISHYLVLCVVGLFLAVAYDILGLIGVVVFALPAFMMHYSQKQYVERTEESVGELRRMNQELTLANREIVAAGQAMRALNDELFLTLAKIIDARDPYAAGHAAKVAEYAVAMAARLGLPEDRREALRQAALLHDIGKLGIPERILHKPASLTEGEYDVVKNHPQIGADFLETCRGLQHLAPIVKRHHEWWDGRGYPGEMSGSDIPAKARILAVCDAAEAMASDRPYHRGMSLDEIVAELQRCAGTQFDPAVVEAFVEVARHGEESFLVNSAERVARHRAAAQRGSDQDDWWFNLHARPEKVESVESVA